MVDPITEEKNMRRLIVLKKSKGQAALEYSVLISVAIAALVAMQIYMKHSYEGKLRSSIDDVGKQSDVMGLQIDITRNSTSETIELSGNGDTISCMGYDDTGAEIGEKQETTLKQDSNEKIPSYKANDPLWP